jgi:CheY-like chemotaxis protein
MARVLIADDNPQNRALVRSVLERAGHEVLEAGDGSETLLTAMQSKPELVLLDLWLPGMSGPDLLRALYGDTRLSATVIALYTATKMSPALRDLMTTYGIEHVIPKSSEPQELLAAVERALPPEPSP